MRNKKRSEVYHLKKEKIHMIFDLNGTWLHLLWRESCTSELIAFQCCIISCNCYHTVISKRIFLQLYIPFYGWAVYSKWIDMRNTSFTCFESFFTSQSIILKWMDVHPNRYVQKEIRFDLHWNVIIYMNFLNAGEGIQVEWTPRKSQKCLFPFRFFCPCIFIIFSLSSFLCIKCNFFARVFFSSLMKIARVLMKSFKCNFHSMDGMCVVSIEYVQIACWHQFSSRKMVLSKYRFDLLKEWEGIELWYSYSMTKIKEGQSTQQ